MACSSDILAVVRIFQSIFAVLAGCYNLCPSVLEVPPPPVRGCNTRSFTDMKMLANMQHTVKKTFVLENVVPLRVIVQTENGVY